MVAIYVISNSLSWTAITWEENFTEQGFNYNNLNIGPDNGLVPNRRQAIIYTNNGLVYWRIYASLFNPL